MSQENLEAAQAVAAAINRRDAAGLIELADPSFEYQSYLAGLSEGDSAYRGHDGIHRFFRNLTEAWELFHVDVHEWRDGGDKIVALGRLEAKGKASGVEVQARLAWLGTFRAGAGSGRLLSIQFFTNSHEALEAAGLRE
jgi:ketosteroid isomerase-like protein